MSQQLEARLRELIVFIHEDERELRAVLEDAVRMCEAHAQLRDAARVALQRLRAVAATGKPALWPTVHKLEAAIAASEAAIDRAMQP